MHAKIAALLLSLVFASIGHADTANSEIKLTINGTLDAISRRIALNWNPSSDMNGDLSAIISLELTQTGKPRKVRIHSSSGDPSFDRSAVRTVESVEQFDAITEIDQETFDQGLKRIFIRFTPQRIMPLYQ